MNTLPMKHQSIKTINAAISSAKAQAKIAQQLESQGISQDSPEFQEQMQQAVQQAMSIPEIQKFMNRNYKNNYEEWANRILEQSELKHRLKEKKLSYLNIN